MPQGLSIIRPNSFCPNCKKMIKWHENIPILSYMILKGRCSNCRKPISIHYPFVELLTGIMFLYIFVTYNLTLEAFLYVFFFCALIVISAIDFSYQIIPDIITIPGIFVGLILQLTNHNFVLGLIGMIFGGGLILLIRTAGGWVYKKEIMGLGDVYLTAMIGAFVGWPYVIVSIFIAAFVGSIFGIVYIASTHQSRESPIPFGPFLSVGGATVIILHPMVIKLFALLGIYL